MLSLKLSSSTASLTGPVLVFDSGVGGLSIVQALQQQLPNLPLVYACDNAAFPYGEKEASWLKQRLVYVIGRLIEEVQPSLVVIACNTASTLALEELRATYKLPFVGVVPAIKPAAALTKTGVVALLATCGTIKRPYTQELINKYAQNCVVLRLGSNELVKLAESYLCENTLCLASLEEILTPLFTHKQLDTIILGCTHFPLLKEPMQSLAKKAGVNWQWVDSGNAIANRVASLLANTSLPSETPAACWFTQALTANNKLPSALEKLGFQQINLLANCEVSSIAKAI